jgi:hypothetical protein
MLTDQCAACGGIIGNCKCYSYGVSHGYFVPNQTDAELRAIKLAVKMTLEMSKSIQLNLEQILKSIEDMEQ